MIQSHSSLLQNWHRTLLHVIRLSFWFACFLAVIGVVWRPPLASVGLIALFLLLLVLLEWLPRRLVKKNLLPKTESAEPIEGTVQQQMTRSKTPDGLERLDGTFLAEFPADAMTTTIHIPFCPSFERIPQVQVFPVDAIGVQLRITSLKTFGVRVDIKRSNVEIDRLHFAMIAEG